MPHISLPENAPGIIGLMAAFRETEGPLNAFTNAAMCGPSSLTRAEREMIAAFVSARNQCVF
jgi:hypothetical protein